MRDHSFIVGMSNEIIVVEVIVLALVMIKAVMLHW